MARRAHGPLAATALLLALHATPSAAETRSYVVSFFAQQFASVDGDCPGGLNPEDERGQTAVILRTMGYDAAAVRRLMARYDAGGDARDEVEALLERRAVIDGEPVNPMTHPEAVPDPGLKFVEASRAYGFDLDGRQGPEDFEDPQTREPGIDHQLFRALGCNLNFRGNWTTPSAYGEWVWVQLRDSQPAWLLTITGADLGRDGPVRVRIERALEHLRSNADGSPRLHMTYRADPDPRSVNEFDGELRDGTLLIAGDRPLSILWNGLSAPVLNLARFHARLALQPGGALDGLVGGYQPWRELYFAFSHNGIVGDRPGLWHAMKKAADYAPDPKTGQNLAISAAYRLSAVPAFVVRTPDSRTASR